MSDPSDVDPLPERDYDRYETYWHGGSVIIFDAEQPQNWIRSSVYVAVPDDMEPNGGADRGSGYGSESESDSEPE